MGRMIRRYATAVIAVAAQVLPAADGAAQVTFRALDLTPLGFQPTAYLTGVEDVLAINNAIGAVVGSFMVDIDPDPGVTTLKRHAFLWLPAQAYGLCPGLHDLHTAANLSQNSESVAHDINDAGFVVGQVGGIGPDSGQAYVWVLSTSVTACGLGYLNPQAQTPWSVAYGINDDTPPLVVGDSKQSGIFCTAVIGGFRTAFNFGPGCPTPSLTALSALAGDNAAWPRDINETNSLPNPPNLAETVGFSYVADACGGQGFGCDPFKDAVTWPPDAPQQPQLLTRLSADVSGHEARGNNHLRNIVGSGHMSNQEPCFKRALFWQSKDAAPFDLHGSVPPIPPFQQTHAEGINDLGPLVGSNTQVVGWNETTGHALRWEKAGSAWNVIDLEAATCDCAGQPGSFLLVQAHDVNNGAPTGSNPWIVALGNAAPPTGSDYHAYLLRPVQSCPADLNGNGHVNGVDLNILMANVHSCVNCTDLCCECIGNLDGDCDVDRNDQSALIGAWGPCPGFGPTCPQPTSAASLNQGVQAMGFASPAAYQAWLTQASEQQALVMGQLLVVLLAP